MAVAEVTVQGLKSKHDVGPLDPVFAPTNATSRCQTCGNDALTCWGHMGCIRLPMAVYSPIATQQTLTIIRCVCYNCSRPLADANDERLQSLPPVGDSARLAAIKKFCTRRPKLGVTCPHCTALQPSFELPNQSVDIIAYWDTPKTGTALMELLGVRDAGKLRGNSRAAPTPGADAEAETETEAETAAETGGAAPGAGGAAATRAVPVDRVALTTLVEHAWLLREEDAEKARACAEAAGCTMASWMMAQGREWERRLREGLREFRAFTKQPWTATMTFAVFDGISEADARFLGITGIAHNGEEPRWTGDYMHPRHLLLRVFPVMPPTCRPSTVVTEGACKEAPNDLTRSTASLAKEARECWKLIRGVDVHMSTRTRKSSKTAPDPERAWRLFHVDEHPCLAKTGFRDEDVCIMTPYGAQAFLMSLPGTYARLQQMAAAIIANDGRKTKCSNSRHKTPLDSIKNRLEGKKGRFRQNLLGCRCNYTARAVIHGDPTLPLHHIGVPKVIADELTYPETVTSINAARMREYVVFGDDAETAPAAYRGTRQRGAASVQYADGRTVLLRHMDESARRQLPLPIGAVVNRWLDIGDVVLFNRQPSLDKYNIMAFYARISPHRAISFNDICTKPFNADFDGDEMNLHVPQTLAARAEAIVLMGVQHNNVTVRNSSMTYGLVQDALTQAYRVCSRDVFFTQEQFSQMVMQLRRPRRLPGGAVLPVPAVFTGGLHAWGRGRRLYTGKQLWTMLLRDEISMEPPSRPIDYGAIFADADERAVIILNGEIVTGRLRQPQLKLAANSLSHIMALYVGKAEASHFLTDTQRVMNHSLLTVGLTSSARHMRPPTDLSNRMTQWVDVVRARLRTALRRPTMRHVNRRAVERMVSKILMHSMLYVSKSLLRQMRNGDTVGASENSIVTMISAGSKGSEMNIMQIAGLIGQQTVQDGRLCGGNERRRSRCVPSFMPGDYGAAASGFVGSCFLRGLPIEGAYQHDMAGREGLVNTSVRTADTGHLEHEMAGFMQPAATEWGGFVSYSGTVMSTEYGGDGFDASWLHPVVVTAALVPDASIVAAFRSARAPADTAPRAAGCEGHHPVVSALFRWRDMHRGGGRGTWVAPRLTVKAHLPFSIHRLLLAMKPLPGPLISADTWNDDVWVPLCGAWKEMLAQSTEKRMRCVLMTTAWDLRPEEVVGRVTAGTVRRALEAAVRMFHRALVAPKEPVGVVAAQSIGAPATQSTLDTFHQTGFSEGVQVVQGFQREKELLNTSTMARGDMKTPTMSIAVRKHVAATRLQRFVRDLITTRLTDITETQHVVYAPLDTGSAETARHTVTGMNGMLDEGMDEDADGNVGKAEEAEETEEGREFSVATRQAQMEDAELMSRTRQMFGEERDMIPGSSIPVGERETAVASMYVIRFVLNIDKSRSKRLIPFVVAKVLARKVACCTVIYSHPSDEQWVIRIRLWQNQSAVDTQRQAAALLRDTSIAGMGSIRNAVELTRGEQRVSEENGSLETVECRRVLTEGTAFMSIASLPWVDWRRTTTNSVFVAYRTLGIHAAQLTLVRELRQVINGDGKEVVSPRHIALMAAAMCITGEVRPITHSGFRNTPQIGTLATTAFEKATDTLAEAALCGRVDSMSSATANVLMGQSIPYGTGGVQLRDGRRAATPKHIHPWEVGPLVKDVAPRTKRRGSSKSFYTAADSAGIAAYSLRPPPPPASAPTASPRSASVKRTMDGGVHQDALDAHIHPATKRRRLAFGADAVSSYAPSERTAASGIDDGCSGRQHSGQHGSEHEPGREAEHDTTHGADHNTTHGADQDAFLSRVDALLAQIGCLPNA